MRETKHLREAAMAEYNLHRGDLIKFKLVGCTRMKCHRLPAEASEALRSVNFITDAADADKHRDGHKALFFGREHGHAHNRADRKLERKESASTESGAYTSSLASDSSSGEQDEATHRRNAIGAQRAKEDPHQNHKGLGKLTHRAHEFFQARRNRKERRAIRRAMKSRVFSTGLPAAVFAHAITKEHEHYLLIYTVQGWQVLSHGSGRDYRSELSRGKLQHEQFSSFGEAIRAYQPMSSEHTGTGSPSESRLNEQQQQTQQQQQQGEFGHERTEQTSDIGHGHSEARAIHA